MLTDLSIKNLMRQDRRPEKRKEVPDGKIGGLYLVLQPSGAASWALRYRAAGKPAKLTLGPYPALDLATARKRAQEAVGAVAGGRDPAADKRAAREARKAERADDTVRNVAEQFNRRYVATKIGEGWGKEIDRMFRVEILPAIGDRRIGDVRKQDINRILDGLIDRGSPITANRCLAVMRKFFNWTTDDREIISVSPCRGVSAPAQESSRDRVLSDKEIQFAWRAFESVGWPFGPIAKLLLLTGARRDEIAEARWSEINIAAKNLTIAKERSKNGVAHEIPLSDAAIEIIAGLPHIGDRKDGFIFTTTSRTAVSGFSNAKAAIDEAVLKALRSDAASQGDDPETVTVPPHWTIHDLRRTVATNLQKLGVRLEVTEAVLNHVSGSRAGIVGIYQRHDWAAEKRQALNSWARRLGAIVRCRMSWSWPRREGKGG
jgi:integrase